MPSTMDGSPLLLLMASIVSDDNDMVSPVGPFLFFLSDKPLTTFEAFRFWVLTIPFVPRLDPREEGMLPVRSFFFWTS
jgi:hypothetical protein